MSLFIWGNNLTEITVTNFIIALENQKIILEANKNRGTGLMRLVLDVRF